MKKIHFEPNVPAEIRVMPRPIAMTILEAIHRYAETGAGHRIADRREAYR